LAVYNNEFILVAHAVGSVTVLRWMFVADSKQLVESLRQLEKLQFEKVSYRISAQKTMRSVLDCML